MPTGVHHRFLTYVRDHTWRNQTNGHFTKEHASDALAFGNEIAARYISWRVFGRVLDNLDGVRALLELPDLSLQQVRDHATQLYINMAALVTGAVTDVYDKANAAALDRHDPAVLLANLPETAQRYLNVDANAFLELFEWSVRARIPNFDERNQRKMVGFPPCYN
ncbi:hypothetical protein NKH18_45155 [Streptomyces sp. M10(2022)]